MPALPFLILPLDSRPVCYDQVLDLANAANLAISLPPPNYLGHLKSPAPFLSLKSWWREALTKQPESTVIAALDTLAYGGLIASRVNSENLETLYNRFQWFWEDIKPTHKPRYGFSSILRIPDYDNSEEEPDYWQEYGKALSVLSAETHRRGTMPDPAAYNIPANVVQDFMARREKNFRLNERFLHLLETGDLQFLIFCQDDTGSYGLNVKEAEFLKSKIEHDQIGNWAFVQTGADEIVLMLLAKSLWQNATKPLHIFPWYIPDHGKKAMARFDGMPLANVVNRHIQTLGGCVCLSPKDADLILLVNAPSQEMGDHCAMETPAREPENIFAFVEALQTWLPQKNIAVADVVYANGAEPLTVRQCLQENIPLADLVAYAGWNTPGNSIGTALATGAVIAWAQQNGCFNREAHQKLLLKRFLDDWLYQAEVRGVLRKQFETLPSEAILNSEMAPGAQLLKSVCGWEHLTPHFSFPCQRFFEIQVTL
jgi:Protein of unknown function (DUF4127)